MINRIIETYPSYKIFITTVQNQLFLTASISGHDTDPGRSVEQLYARIAQLLTASSYQIVHERCFGNIEFQGQLLQARTHVFQTNGVDINTPTTYIEGRSCSGTHFAGVQIRAIRTKPEIRIRTIMDQGIPKGRAWNLNGATFFMLQNVNSGNIEKYKSKASQSETMFHQAERLLRAEGATYQDVVRTWIYLSDLLDWYTDFNTTRNRCYADYGFLGSTTAEAEQIYLPASTGIEGKNPSGLAATMDVFAVHRSGHCATTVRAISGTKQRSPFRYGSAFSRAMVVEDSLTKMILVSGTASIDEQGKSVFPGDAAAQIHQSLNVVAAIAELEGATLQDICEATVFIKRKEDFPVFQKVIAQVGIPDLPSVNVMADVCRDELLFELDAVFLTAKK
jgi:enamine deaminase RidA (YjgF/YER057c/UK114 family)